MSGLTELLSLPEEIKNSIADKYGSVVALYQRVFNLNAEEHRLTGSKSPRLDEIQNELFDIEEELDSISDSLDGNAILSDIAGDFGDIIVGKRIADLNAFLQPLGTDFEAMRKWLRDTYGI